MTKRILTALVSCALFLAGAATAEAMQTRDRRVPTPEIPAATLSLDGSDWTLSFWKQGEEPVTAPDAIPSDARSIPATVPGNVDIDLCAAGLEADPRIGLNNYLTRQWEDFQWCYSKSFAAPAVQTGQRLHLRFDGIDTIADIWLNGEHVGSTENMMIEHVFDVTDLLRPEGTASRSSSNPPSSTGANRSSGPSVSAIPLRRKASTSARRRTPSAGTSCRAWSAPACGGASRSARSSPSTSATCIG